MRYLFTVLMIGHCIIGYTPTRAASVDILDFLLDARAYIGKEVTVLDCHLAWSGIISVACIALKPQSEHFDSSPGQVMLDGPTMDREDLRQAIKNCTGDYSYQMQCSVDVTGTVYDLFAELGVENYPILGMKNEYLRWKTTKRMIS